LASDKWHKLSHSHWSSALPIHSPSDFLAFLSAFAGDGFAFAGLAADAAAAFAAGAAAVGVTAVAAAFFWNWGGFSE